LFEFIYVKVNLTIILMRESIVEAKGYKC